MNANVTAAFQQHLAQRRANIMNMFTNPQDAIGDEVSKAEENDIEKARSGVYADTAENRRWGRVGLKYGPEQDKIKKERLAVRNSNGEVFRNSDFAEKYLKDVKEVVFPEVYKKSHPNEKGYEKTLSNGDIIEMVMDDFNTGIKIRKREVRANEGNGIYYTSINSFDASDKNAVKNAVKFFNNYGNEKTVKKAEETEEVEEVDETEEENEYEKTDAEKAEIISLIGIEQLDVWKGVINELADEDDETEKAEKVVALDREIQDFADINGVEKSDIMYALNGYETKIKFRKSGKEIKEQLNSVVIPALNADLAIAKSEADAVLKECGDAPTHDVPEYWTGDLKIDLDYKFYEWDETRVPDTNNTGIISSFSPESYKSRCCKNAAATQEEADARCKYNECVRKIANITTDVKACEIVAKNLKDNESVELTVRQLVAFKFA